MACWYTSVIRTRTRMTPSAPCRRGWRSSRPWQPLKARLAADKSMRLAVRLGIHTGLVVVGEVGAGGAAGTVSRWETRRTWRRVSKAWRGPTRWSSADATWRLVQGYFASHDLGPQTLKGVETPVPAYQRAGAEWSAESVGRLLSSRRPHAAGGAGDRRGAAAASAGRRHETVWARWCCSAARRASASHAWSWP